MGSRITLFDNIRDKEMNCNSNCIQFFNHYKHHHRNGSNYYYHLYIQDTEVLLGETTHQDEGDGAVEVLVEVWAGVTQNHIQDRGPDLDRPAIPLVLDRYLVGANLQGKRNSLNADLLEVS